MHENTIWKKIYQRDFDNVAEASKRKTISNAGVNFGFGLAEGAVVGAVTAVFALAGFHISTGFIYLIKLKCALRERPKKALNSLD